MTDAEKAVRNKALAQTALEVVVALAGSALVIGLNLLSQVVLEPDAIAKYKADPMLFKKLLSVQFDITVIAATLVVGAALGLDSSKRGKLFWVTIALLGGLILLLVLAVIAAVVDSWHPDALRYGIPDAIGVALLFFAARAVVIARA